MKLKHIVVTAGVALALAYSCSKLMERKPENKPAHRSEITQQIGIAANRPLRRQPLIDFSAKNPFARTDEEQKESLAEQMECLKLEYRYQTIARMGSDLARTPEENQELRTLQIQLPKKGCTRFEEVLADVEERLLQNPHDFQAQQALLSLVAIQPAVSTACEFANQITITGYNNYEYSARAAQPYRTCLNREEKTLIEEGLERFNAMNVLLAFAIRSPEGEKLLAHVTAFNMNEMHYGAPLDDLFTYFDNTPASGQDGQVREKIAEVLYRQLETDESGWDEFIRGRADDLTARMNRDVCGTLLVEDPPTPTGQPGDAEELQVYEARRKIRELQCKRIQKE